MNGTSHAERIADLHIVQFSNGKIVGDNISSAIWEAGTSAEVWVDFNYAGEIQIGTFDFPYKTLIGGLAGVLSGGVVKMKSGLSSEIMTIAKPVTLEAYNGKVVIGKK